MRQEPYKCIGRRVEGEYTKFRPLSAVRYVIVALSKCAGINQHFVVNAQVSPRKTLTI
jgi:hypothetical protein